MIRKKVALNVLLILHSNLTIILILYIIYIILNYIYNLKKYIYIFTHTYAHTNIKCNIQILNTLCLKYLATLDVRMQ